MRGSRATRSHWPTVLVAVVSFAFVSTTSAQAVEIVDEIPVDPGSGGGAAVAYTPSEDGNIWWTVGTGGAGGPVRLLDSDTGDILESFTVSRSGYFPLSMGYFNGRVYIQSDILLSYATTPGATDPGVFIPDSGTRERMHPTSRIRVNAGGAALMVGGPKAAQLNFADTSNPNPYYPQAFWGVDINNPGAASPEAAGWEGCTVSEGTVIIGEPESCGTRTGGGWMNGSPPGYFDQAIDGALDDDLGFYVLEGGEATVSHVATNVVNGQVLVAPDFKFGSSGTGNGQLSSPISMVRNPSNGNLLIASQGTRRIDEFTGAGGYVRSLGFGVLTGENKFEICGVGIGSCRAGIDYATESRSYFTQLDLVGGDLWAATPLDRSIQVIDLGAAGSSTVRLKASPKRVKKNRKATLTAKLGSCEAGFRALFQIKVGRDYDNLGRAVKVDDSCKASKQVAVSKKSVFRAVSIDAAQNTLATSNEATVKVK